MTALMVAEPDPAGTTFRLREDALTWRRVGDEIVALDLGRSVYLRINRTGAVLWTALAAGASRPELLEIAVQGFRVDAELAAADIDSLLADLSGRGLLEDPAGQASETS